MTNISSFSIFLIEYVIYLYFTDMTSPHRYRVPGTLNLCFSHRARDKALWIRTYVCVPYIQYKYKDCNVVIIGCIQTNNR